MKTTISRQRAMHTALLLAGCAAPLASHAISAPREEVAAFLGTTVEAIEALNPRAGDPPPPENDTREVTRGVAMRRALTLAAGDTVSFDWFFGTDEGPAGANNDIVDFAFFSVNGLPSLLASGDDTLELATGSPFTEQLAPLTPGGAYFRTLTLNFDAAGDYLLGFAVVDTVDTVVESGLVLDNVRLNGVLIDNGGFEDNSVSGSTTLFPGWETLGDVSPWDNQPPATEGNVGAALMSGNFVPTVVPVPAAAWLFGSALASLAWQRRRRG